MCGRPLCFVIQFLSIYDALQCPEGKLMSTENRQNTITGKSSWRLQIMRQLISNKFLPLSYDWPTNLLP